MKYNARNLAKGLFGLVKEDPKMLEGFVGFCRKKRLTYLLPSMFKYFLRESAREKDENTLKIYTAFGLSENFIDKIKKISKAESAETECYKKEDLIGGFVAYYQNKVIDASFKNNLAMLKNKLINI